MAARPTARGAGGAPVRRTAARATGAARPSEGELLRRAQEALRDAPVRALALVRQHAALYPAGVLAQEREVIGIEALAALGRMDEARGAAREFLARHADSPHRGHVQALLGRAGTQRNP